MERNQVIVKKNVLQQDMYYKNQIIMRYTIQYPHFISDKFQTIVYKLNALYRTKALMYERSNIMKLYQMAMVEYEYSIANDFPIRQFEAFVDYIVTYNHNCTISLYFDQYEFAGGAHGLTYRYSDTWDLQKSKRMDLRELFSNRINCKLYVINNILNQIEMEETKEKLPYFDDYSKRVNENFKENNFYLVKEGVVIYFQQYDIAPYAFGLPTFLIPYGANGAREPQCET